MKVINFRWVIINDLMIGHGTSGPVDDTVWNEYVSDLETKPITRYLGAMVGAFSVNSIQRKVAAEVAKKKKIKIGVLTDDRLVRGLVTAVAWMGTDIRAFSWNEMEAVFQFLKVSGPLLLRAREAIRELEAASAANMKEIHDKR